MQHRGLDHHPATDDTGIMPVQLVNPFADFGIKGL
jgi:hypothetical protein